MAKLMELSVGVLLVAGMLLFIGCFIETSVSIPGYATVFIDDHDRTFVAVPCIDAWQKKPGASQAVARRATAAEAWQLGYKMDDDCRETGAFQDDDWPLTGLLFVKLGVLPAAEHWWDAPYRTEQGVVWPSVGKPRP